MTNPSHRHRRNIRRNCWMFLPSLAVPSLICPTSAPYFIKSNAMSRSAFSTAIWIGSMRAPDSKLTPSHPSCDFATRNGSMLALCQRFGTPKWPSSWGTHGKTEINRFGGSKFWHKDLYGFRWHLGHVREFGKTVSWA